ncbi:MAG: hypothetical protein KAU21_19625 [Gammaproteobacteria bacterium]|nr:hypothetical protein [Gammaproteobacteria bacterium]
MSNGYTNKYSNTNDRALAMAKLIKEQQVAKETKKTKERGEKKNGK